MNKIKRIASIIVVIFILSLYLITFLSSLFVSKYTKELFMASIFSTMVFPIVIYAYMLIYRLVHRKNDPTIPEEKKHQDIPKTKK
jgi:hypothetical protein